MIAYYNAEPGKMQYMPLPDRHADVWLRRNITETTDDDGNSCWECEEVSFRTSLSEDEIKENFDAIFENGGPVVDGETEEEVADGVTLKERVDANEEAIAELAEIIAELAG